MKELNKSVSEAMRIVSEKIAETTQIGCETFTYPNGESIACSLGITQINSVKNTGDFVVVSLGLHCDCRVSRTYDNSSMMVVELAMSVYELLTDGSMSVCGSIPSNIQAVPFSEDDSAAEWQVFWDQTFYVEKFNDKPNTDAD